HPGIFVPTLFWSSLEDHPLSALRSSNLTHSVLTLDPVGREHEGSLLCSVTCGKEKRQLQTSVRVYSFPSAPVIAGQDQLKLGVESALTCHVPDIYPTAHLNLTWVRGDTVLISGTSGPLEYRFTPQKQDSGGSITCRATLEMEKLSAPNRTRETTVLLNSGPLKSFSPLPNLAQANSSLTLNCSAEGNPDPRITWSFKTADGWSVRKSEAGRLFVCEARNKEGNSSATVVVNVFGKSYVQKNPRLIITKRPLGAFCIRSKNNQCRTLVLQKIIMYFLQKSTKVFAVFGRYHFFPFCIHLTCQC
uniref:Ig-like domain-containing protein n=1 Tax=Oryzias sinensis TaxID=183150 RepID=A0A8C8DJ54_9TELE